MEAWLTLIATLAGALVAGGISALLQSISNKHALATARMNFAEERARWATERQLDRIQKFHGTIEKLMVAAVQLRIQQAWSSRFATDITPAPKWVLSYDDARGGYEAALDNANSEMSLMDEDIQLDFLQATHRYFNWTISKTEGEGVQELVEMERELLIFKKGLAQRYRKVFDARRTGLDA